MPVSDCNMDDSLPTFRSEFSCRLRSLNEFSFVIPYWLYLRFSTSSGSNWLLGELGEAEAILLDIGVNCIFGNLASWSFLTVAYFFFNSLSRAFSNSF